MTKRILWALLLIVAGSWPATAQTTVIGVQPRTLTRTFSTTSDGSDCATTSCLTQTMAGFSGVAVQITGTCGTCTIVFEGSIDGTNYVALSLAPSNTAVVVSSTTTAGIWQGTAAVKLFRARMSARSSGSFVVTTFGIMGPIVRTGSGAAAAGSDTYVQFNDGGIFGGDAGFTYNKTTDVGTLVGGLVLGNGGALKTTTTTAQTGIIQAYDVDNTTYRTFGTLTNGNTPSFNLAPPSGGTMGGAFTTLSQGGFAISLAGTLTTSGAFATTITTTAATGVTLPTTGTLTAASAIKTAVVAGGAAGNIAVSGIAVGDQLTAVVRYVGAGIAVTDVSAITSEFTISGTNEINNTGGTNTTGDKLEVRWVDLTP